MPSLQSMKKDDLVVYASKADEKIRYLAQENHELRTKLAMARNVGLAYQQPSATHRSYADYVAQCRKEQRAAGAKTIKYLNFEQWLDQRTESYEDYQARIAPPEFPRGEFAPQCNVGPSS